MSQYYTSGQFAKKANISIRTVRYYDCQGLLKPSHMSEKGYRLYTDSDFAKLQKILTLKYLGFSLDEIRDMTLKEADRESLRDSLRMQLNLVRQKMIHWKLIEQSIEETSRMLEQQEEIDWSGVLHLIHVANMEKGLVEQYKNGHNINIRIQLHKDHSINPQGWFPWVMEQLQLQKGQRILEIGCGNGELWIAGRDQIPQGCQITLSDLSAGMVADARSRLEEAGMEADFSYETADCQDLPFASESFDRIAANHVLFYVKNRKQALSEIRRVLKPGGLFVCSTYGQDHMKEITQLVKEFDSRITLSDVNLPDLFGLEHGKEELEAYFDPVRKECYQDALLVDQIEPLVDYILSCHGNQREYLKDNDSGFRSFLKGKIEKNGAIRITKMAGVFCCRKALESRDEIPPQRKKEDIGR